MRRLLFIAALLTCGLAHAEIPETDWLELMPKSDQKALEAMPEIDHNSPEAQGTFDSKGGLKQSKGLPAVMYSAKTVPAMNGKEIRLGGYPVPLETDAKGRSKLLGDIQRQLATDSPAVYMFQLSQFAVGNKRLKGLWSSSPVAANDLAALSWQ